MNLTMTKATELLNRAEKMVTDLGYQVPNYTIKLGNAKTYYGQASFSYDRTTEKKSNCSITLSKWTAKYVDEHDIMDTCLHELAHLVAPHKAHHGLPWQLIVNNINKTYGYNISRVGSKGKVPEAKKQQAKYTITCSCGTSYGYHKKSKMVKIIMGEIKGTGTCPHCKGHDFEITVNR